MRKKIIAVGIIIIVITCVAVAFGLRVRSLSSVLKSSTDTIGNLKTQIDSLLAENEGYKEELKKSQEVSEARGARVASLEQDGQELRKELLTLKKENSALKKELVPIRKLRRELIIKERQLKVAQRASEDQSAKVTNLEQNKQELRERLSGLEKEKAALEKISRAQGIKVAGLEKELSQLQKKFTEKEAWHNTVIERTKKTLEDELDKERQEINADLAAARHYIKLVEEERDEYSEKITKLKKDLEDTSAKLAKANEKNKILQKEISELHYNLGVMLKHTPF